MTRRAARFTGRQAIVTGGGSGIGAALCRALVDAGADVVYTDLDGDAAARTAAGCTGPGTARATALDVTDAAYPVMLRQGHGHLINTASMAGLAAAGQLTSYVMTKHAVVGLSLALRSEAASRGVGVLAICPAVVETPLLDKITIGGLPGREYFLNGQGTTRAYDADRLAGDALRAIDRNKALLVVPRKAHAAWLFARLAPGLLQRASIGFVARQRAGQLAGQTVTPDGP